MCTVITHPVIPIALSAFFPKETISPNLLLIGAVCSIVPDFDVIGFRFGIKYGDMLGHRGLTHSIFFAAALGAVLTLILSRNMQSGRLILFLFLFLSTLSHAILDAMTNGGLGVAFFAPFHNERYFFPWRPIAVSPIGLRNFLTMAGLRVILNELLLVWLPSTVLFTLMRLFRH
jgi:inner membrane protein